MRTTITTDKRFKVTQHKVDKMRELRKQKWKIREIAEYFDVSISTINYWLNPKIRRNMRLKNAKRISCNKKRVEYRKQQYKNYTRENCIGYISRYLERELYKPKEKQCKLFGYDVYFWKKILDKEKKGLLKIS